MKSKLITNSSLNTNKLEEHVENVIFTDAKTFSQYIELIASQNETTCTQTILDYCDSKNIEAEDIARLVNVSLKGKLHQEMIAAGLLPEENTLETF